ncbi:MAG: S-layer homology domain-containing protein [Candidatus Peribacteria bacterium]|nr:S-layer homology domain-containing protein [Candidatus Peribacteria bacterium]
MNDNDKRTAHNDKCSSFTDLNQVNAELQSYIIKACEYGLMGYYADGETTKEYFSPTKEITRAEVATIISRMLRGNRYQ